MMTDEGLLRAYIEDRSNAAFTELVERHVDFVYSTVLRTVREPQLAQDVAQAVFLHLARKAGSIRKASAWPGWLYRVACGQAANAVRAERRRRHREQEAVKMNSTTGGESSVWRELAPLLEEAMQTLARTDQDVVILRFFRGQSLRQIGETLELSEDAAQKRLSRALERLRDYFVRRGVRVSAAALASGLAAHAVRAAPAGMGTAISTTVITSGAALHGAGTLGFAKLALTKAIIMTTTQKLSVTAVITLAVGTGVFEASQAGRMRAKLHEAEQQLHEAEQQVQPMTEEANRLGQERAELTTRLQGAQAQIELLQRDTVELAKLRGEVTKEAADLRAQRERESNGRVEAARQALEHALENNLFHLTNRVHLSAEQVQAVREIMMRQSQAAMVGLQNLQKGKATAEELSAYGKALGNTKEQIKALLTPEQRTEYTIFEQEETASNARVEATLELRQMQSTLGLTTEQQDQVFAALYDPIFNHMSGSSTETVTNAEVQSQWLFDQKAKALESVLTAAQLERYRQQYARERKFFKTLGGSVGGADAVK